MNELTRNAIPSTEVADMVEKTHKELLRDIRRYVRQFNENNLALVKFFEGSTYKDAKGETRPCYLITKKGCEFIAHKLTGTKGTLFTARYINRFHEMQDILTRQEREPQLPSFIHRFRGEYIMLFRDFEAITGISLHPKQAFWKAHHEIMNNRCPLYYNGWGWYTTIDKEEFLKEYGFEYGDDQCMMYLTLPGIRKVLQLCEEDRRFRLEQPAYDTIIKAIEQPKKALIAR